MTAQRATNWVARIRNWWSDLRCKGNIDYLTERDAIARNLLPTSGLDVGLVDSDQLLIFKCSKWSEKCQRCSCVKTVRELFPGSCDWDRNLDVFIGASQRESNRDNRHGKTAEVDNINVDMRDTSGKPFGIAGCDHHLEPVQIPVTPSVEHTQNGTYQSDSKRASLNDCRVHQNFSHSSANYQRGHIAHRTTNWIMAAIIAAGMSTAYLLDTSSDTPARTSSTPSVQDAQTQARQQARFERAARKACGSGKDAFALLEDGSIQCLVQGMTTITAKVAL